MSQYRAFFHGHIRWAHSFSFGFHGKYTFLIVLLPYLPQVKTHMVLIFLLSLESECDILVILLLICEFQALFYNLQRSFCTYILHGKHLSFSLLISKSSFSKLQNCCNCSSQPEQRYSIKALMIVPVKSNTYPLSKKIFTNRYPAGT